MVDNFVRAQDSQTAPEILAILAMDDDLKIAVAAVENPSLPSWALRKVVDSRDDPALVAAAQIHPNWIPLTDEQASSSSRPRPPAMLGSSAPLVLPCTWKDSRTGTGYVWLNPAREPLERASVGTRLLCFVLDFALALFAGFIVALLPSVIAVATGNEDLWGPVDFLIAWAAFFAYWTISYQKWGRTPAMRLGNLMVVNKVTGEQLSWGRALLRALILVLSIPFPAGWIIWWAVTGSSEWRQGPHDFAARSIVVVKS